MNIKPLRFFIDFDGTIAHEDIGDSIFKTFLLPELIEANWHDDLIDEWKAGRISSKECLGDACRNTRVTQPELNAHLNEYELTDGFHEFVDYCDKGGYPVTILSDGMDYYIEYMLKANNLDIEFYANAMSFSDGSLEADFPYTDHGCGRCGNCKRYHMRSLRHDGETVAYVGDGYSDRYAIRDADIVFARRELAEYCDRTGHDYIPFDSFHDIMTHLENGDEHI